MDVGTWLRSLGLDRYEVLFREQAIDVDILPELTDQHLAELGIPLGHRLRLLRAIRELASEPPQTAEPQAPDTPERRQLTVMFCDLVGSTELTAQLDPEDMADLIRAFQGAVAAAVSRFEGHIAKWMGDAAMVYFGYPRAHEDDAERAARAALALIAAVANLREKHAAALEVRIGISTGLVVVGELIGEGEARLRGLVGDTPNLAVRLQSIAEPDTIVVAEATRRLLGEAFELKPLGPQTFRGLAAPVPAWLLAAERENVSRFDASHPEGLTPFVGREEEIALLLDRWRHAADGEGQVAMLSGEAGLGKSRILATLRERLAGQRHVQLRYQCSPHHVNDAFHPVIGQIWRAAGFLSGEPADSRLDKLEEMITSAGLPLQDIAPFFAALLTIPTGDRYPALDIAPSEMKERTMTALIAPVLALARRTPVLMMLEDAHWIDPTSLDLTSRWVEMVRHLPVLFVMTFRPEFVPRWLGRDHVTALSLNRLGRDQALSMIDGVAEHKKLPAAVLDQILAKTDGVPLFIEELTKSVLESELLREDNGGYVLTSALTPLAIPSTLHDSLTARLDRLSPIKETAQIGAAIGREFPHALLEAISPIKGAALSDVLRRLMEAELIYRRGIPPNASYVFKHALVQDAAYGSLLRSRRQRIHAQVALALREHVTEEEYAPATIAHHFTEAGLAASAAPAWLAAAELALSQSAPVEAERHASAGLALIASIAEGGERDALELALLVARANALVPLRSASAPETFAAMTAAKRLLDRGIGTDLQRVSVLYGLCAGTTLAARLDEALAFAREIIEVAERLDDPAYRVLGYRQLATIQFYTGQNREALASLQQGNAHRDQQRQRALSYRFGWDQGIAILCFEVLVRLSLGLLDSAARISDQVLAEVSGHGHATTIASATFCVRTWPQLALHELPALERDSDELASFCADKKVEQIRLLASVHHAYARAMREPAAANIAALRQALDALKRSGGNTGNSIMLSNLAEAELAAGDLDGAEAALNDGFAFVTQSGERYWLADLHRLSGQLALRRREPDPARAEASFHQAIDVARGQQARLLELRAAIDLGRLWRGTRANAEIHALITPILGQIEGGETAPDVQNARALLSELG
jgi:class 3 adenylate cyclase/predicted ATPase